MRGEEDRKKCDEEREGDGDRFVPQLILFWRRDICIPAKVLVFTWKVAVVRGTRTLAYRSTVACITDAFHVTHEHTTLLYPTLKRARSIP